MTVKPRTLSLLTFALSALVVGTVFVARLPSRADCLGSGRTVDSTYRHCIGPAGEVELREHIVGHLITALPVVIAIMILALVVHRLRSIRAAH
jgi:hypothetical protein